jgi:glycosyltransferase involved in cell wall biosynthesis
MNNDISVVLNCYKRPHTLKMQYEAIANQTLRPKNIFIWQNKGDYENFKPFDNDIASNCASSISNANFGVWARFAYALNCRTKYICVFDDDTIPGNKWLQNCYDTIQQYEGLLGTIGVIFHDLEYRYYHRIGWDNPNEKTEKVDIVGHSWFFKREWLGAFWRECEPPLNYLIGEDMHFSYSLQKYLNLNTYVPPHPINDKEMWGSQRDLAYKLGVDSAAISCNYHGHPDWSANLRNYKEKGFKYINSL